MAFLSDKYRPKTLDTLTIHPKANEILGRLAQTDSFPHLLFCGPQGSGKKTRVLAFLRAKFHADIERLRSEYRNIEVNDKKIEVKVTSSPFHVEITPADAGNMDRHVISFFLKEVAASATVSNSPIKIVVINEANRLSRLAQQALRRTMEKYARTCRLILIADSLSQIIEPVRSRCLVIRTPRVLPDDIASIVRDVAEKEKITVDDQMIQEIISLSEGNLRAALLTLDRLILESGRSVKDLAPEWKKYIADLCQSILQSNLTPDFVKTLRNNLYELLIHSIPPTVIFQHLLAGLLPKIDDALMEPVCQSAAIYEERMKNGTKPIFHLETFIAKFIVLYKDSLDID